MRINVKVIASIAAVLFLASLFVLHHVYASLTVAFILAYLLDPIVGKLQKKGIKRSLGVPLTLAVFFILLGLAAVVIIPKIVAQGSELLLRLPTVYYSVTSKLAPVSERYLGYNAFQEVDKFVSTLGDPSTLVKPLSTVV